MSSSVSEICPRSILRYRPIDAEIVPDVSPWIPTAELHRTHITKSSKLGAWSSVVSMHASSSLATVVGLGMCVMLILIMIGQWFAGWAQVTFDDWHYGRPRTFQTDSYVGQEATGLPSHFVAIDNRGQVEIIELPGNDPAHARLFLGPHLTGMNADLTPITLHFVDLHHTHHPDMIVQCGNASFLFLNREGTFQLSKQES